MTPLRGTTRSLIEAARPAERPTDADKDRVRARVMAKVAGAGAAAAIATAASKAAGQAVAGSAAAGATAGAGSAAAGAGSAAAGAGAAVVATGTTAGIVKAVVIGTIAGVCALGASQMAPKAPPATPSVAATAVVTSAPVARPEPPAPAVDEAPKPVAPAPEPRAVRAEAKPPSSAGMREEIEVLKEAQRAIAAGQTDRAMALLDEHAQRWKGGALAEERLAARAIALCEAGRGDEARRAAARFFAEAKGSPLEDRVRAACATALSGQGRETK